MITKRLIVGGLIVAVVTVAARFLARAPEPAEAPAAVAPSEPRGAPRGEPRSEAQPPSRRADAPAGAERSVDASPPAAAAEPATAPDASRRFIFDCGNGVIFSVRTIPGEATLFSPQALGAEVITVPQVAAAPNARYEAGDVSFSSRGGLATFEIRERTFADCTSNPGAAQTAEARRRGAAFRAHGNAPSWELEIAPERIALALRLDADTRRVDFPYREPATSGSRATYRTFSGTQELLVIIDRAACNDTQTGEAFESMVTVTFESRTLYGCGQAP
jgi:uncharacterized membrane protein/membrane-bound inhibitor of C-type lysozyme